MNASPPDTPRGVTGRSLKVARIAGIEVRLDPSVVIIFALIVFSLGAGVFSEWHPDWGVGLIWLTAVTSGVLFFLSLLAHELAHSVVSQYHGYPVPRITLFLFGGMAEMSREPDKPGIELQVAIAGPLMSIVISLACSAIVTLMVADPAVVEAISNGEAEALASLGPVETSLLWLGSINFILAVFNMIPGFPMDGGRVFRSIMWAITGDQIKATRWASTLGRIFGWTLIALGVVTLMGGNVSGLWSILIGWFISNLARMSYTQLLTDRALKGFKVEDLMNTVYGSVEASTSLPDFIDDFLLRSTQRVWPVVRKGVFDGFVILDDIVPLDPADRAGRTVNDVMRSLERMHYLDADATARQALETLSRTDIEPLPVLEHGRLVGFLSRGDVMRWMALHEFE